MIYTKKIEEENAKNSTGNIEHLWINPLITLYLPHVNVDS